MRELLQTGLLRFTAAAIFTSVAESVCPPGAMKRVCRMTGNLLLLAVLLSALLPLRGVDVNRLLAQYRQQQEQTAADTRQDHLTQLTALIEQRSAAYIADKAAQLGVECRVEVTCRQQEGAYYPLPYSVTLTGRFSAAGQAALTGQIEAEFAIPAQRQYYEQEGP